MAKQVHQMKLDPLEMKNTNGFESDTTGHIDEGQKVQKIGELSKDQIEKDNADSKKQKELDKMKKLILQNNNENLIKGYLEILVGEKMNQFEDEVDNQKKLLNSQKFIKLMVQQNLQNLKDLGDPKKNVIHKKNLTIEQKIDEIEKNMKNQYYSQLGKIIKADTKRKVNESKNNLLKKQKQKGGRSSEMLPSFMADAEELNSLQDSEDQNSMFENFNKMVAQQDKQTLENKAKNSIQQNSSIKIENKYKSITDKNASFNTQNRQEQENQIKTKFGQKKLSEISEQNMQLLQNPQQIAYKKSPIINKDFQNNQQFSIGNVPQIRSPSHLIQLPGNHMNSSILNQINQSSSKQFNKTQFVKMKKQNEQIENNEMQIEFTDQIMSGPNGQQSTNIIVNSRLNTPKDKNAFISPLNEKLDRMKKSLHNLMFNSTVEDKLLSKDSFQEIQNNPEQTQSYLLAKQLKEQIMSDLQMTDQQYFNYNQNQNYSNIYSNNYYIGNQGNVLQGINNHNIIPNFNEIQQQIQYINPLNISIGQTKNFTNQKNEFNITQTGTFMNESFQRQAQLNREGLVITAPEQLQNSFDNRHHISQQPSTAFVNDINNLQDNPDNNLFIQNEAQQTHSVDIITKQTSKVHSLKSKMTIDQIFESENQLQKKSNQHQNINIINQVEPFQNQNYSLQQDENQNFKYQQNQMINQSSGDIQVNEPNYQSNMFENNDQILISSQYQIVGNQNDQIWQNQNLQIQDQQINQNNMIDNNEYQEIIQKQNEISQLMKLLVDNNGNQLPYDQMEFQNYLNQQEFAQNGINQFQDLDDHILEQNLRSLDERISQISPKSLKSKDITKQNITNKPVDNQLKQTNFQSSHICYVQAIVSQKHKYKERLKDFDKHKCTFINDLQRNNKVQLQSKISKQAIQMKPQIHISEIKDQSKIISNEQRSREYISISHGDSIEHFANQSLSKLLNQKQTISNQYKQLVTESTAQDEKQIQSRVFLQQQSPSDFNQKLNQQIQLNNISEQRFKQYLLKLKKEFGMQKYSSQQRSGDNLNSLRIDLVAQSNQSLLKNDHQKTSSNKKLSKVLQNQESQNLNKVISKRYHNEFFQRKKYSLENHLKSTNIFAQTNLRTLDQRLQQDDNHQQINENSEYNMENLTNSKNKLKSKINQFKAVDQQQQQNQQQLKKNIIEQLKNQKIQNDELSNEMIIKRKDSVQKLQKIAAIAFQNQKLKNDNLDSQDLDKDKNASIRIDTGISIDELQQNISSNQKNLQNAKNTIQNLKKNQIYQQYLMATPYSQTNTNGLLDSAAGLNLTKSTQSKLEQILMLDDQIYQQQNNNKAQQNIQPPMNSKETDSIQEQIVIQAEEVDIVRQVQTADQSQQNFQKMTQNHQRKIVDFQNKSNQMEDSYKNLMSQQISQTNINNDINNTLLSKVGDSKLGKNEMKKIYKPAIIGLELPINQQEYKDYSAKFNILAKFSQQINSIKVDNQVSFDNLTSQKTLSSIQKQIQMMNPQTRINMKKIEQIQNENIKMIQQTNNKIWNIKNNNQQNLQEFQIQSPLHINKMNQTLNGNKNPKQNIQNQKIKQNEYNIQTKLPSVVIEGRASSQVGDAIESAQLSSTQKNFNDFSSNKQTKKGKGSIADQFHPNSPIDIYKQNSFRNHSGFSFQSSTQDALGYPMVGKNNIQTFNQYFQNQNAKDKQILKNEYLLQQKLQAKQNINVYNSENANNLILKKVNIDDINNFKINQGFHGNYILQSPVILQQKSNDNEFNLTQQKQTPREIIEFKKNEEIKERNKIIHAYEQQKQKQGNQKISKKKVQLMLQNNEDDLIKLQSQNVSVVENGGDISQNDKQKNQKQIQSGFYLQNNIDMQKIIELNQFQIEMSQYMKNERSISGQQHNKEINNNFVGDRINKQFRPTPTSHITKSALSRQTSNKHQKNSQNEKYNTIRDSINKQSIEFPMISQIQNQNKFKTNQISPQILKIKDQKSKNEINQLIQKDEVQNSLEFIESNLSQAQNSSQNQQVKIVKSQLDNQISTSQNQMSEDKLDDNQLDQGTLIYTQEFPEDIAHTQQTSVYVQNKKKQFKQKVNKDLLLKSQNQSIQSIKGIKIELQKNPKLNIGNLVKLEDNMLNDDISNLTNRKYQQNDPRQIYNDAKKEKDKINMISLNQSLHTNKEIRKIQNGSAFDQNSNSTHAQKKPPMQTQVSIINLSEMI